MPDAVGRFPESRSVPGRSHFPLAVEIDIAGSGPALDAKVSARVRPGMMTMYQLGAGCPRCSRRRGARTQVLPVGRPPVRDASVLEEIVKTKERT